MQSLEDSAVPSDIFPHVYSFLVRSGFLKSAKVFRREANVPRVVVDTPGLLDFYEAFKKRKNKIVEAPKKIAKKDVVAPKKRKADKQVGKQTSKKAKKDSSSSESELVQPVKLLSNSTKASLTSESAKLQSKKKKLVATKQQEESSDSSSSDSETVAAPTKTKPLPVNDKKKPKPVAVKKKEASSSESSSDESIPPVSGALPKHQKILAAVKKSSDSSSDDSSDEDEPKKTATKVTIQANKQSSSSDSSSSDGNDDNVTTKPASTASNIEPLTSTPGNIAAQGKTKKSKANANQPFRRVDMDTSVNPKMADNSFEAKGGSRGSWGEKAHHVLKNTKGRSFRHEKTKKKRGSYTGGRIDTSVHSVTFDESD